MGMASVVLLPIALLLSAGQLSYSQAYMRGFGSMPSAPASRRQPWDLTGGILRMDMERERTSAKFGLGGS